MGISFVKVVSSYTYLMKGGFDFAIGNERGPGKGPFGG
jgi:hypothetical protein